jgi:hypothetical protein
LGAAASALRCRGACVGLWYCDICLERSPREVVKTEGYRMGFTGAIAKAGLVTQLQSACS